MPKSLGDSPPKKKKEDKHDFKLKIWEFPGSDFDL